MNEPKTFLEILYLSGASKNNHVLVKDLQEQEFGEFLNLFDEARSARLANNIIVTSSLKINEDSPLFSKILQSQKIAGRNDAGKDSKVI